MVAHITEEQIKSILEFELPEYHQIPDIGLFLDQTSKYLDSYLSIFPDMNLTGSMISNYVKKKIIVNPVKKQYSRDQIAYLFFIAAAKSVMSLEDIELFIRMQKAFCDTKTAYEYYRREFKASILYVYGLDDSLPQLEADAPAEKSLLRTTIIAAAHKAYLSMCFKNIH